MKKFILSIILAITLIASPASAEFFRDVIVTSPNGIWTDSRAYTTLNAAITAVGANERTIKIVSPQTVTTLTVPANVTLSFERDGSIANSGQLTINTKNIIAPNRQIFTGTGDIDFAPGSIVRTGWFSSTVVAFDVTNDDELTLIISKSAFITANCAVGDNVSLKWESARNRLTANGGFTLSNIKNIEAGNYQLFAGAGDFDFLDGAELKLNWFNQLSDVLTWVESEEVTIIVNEDSVVQASVASAANENIKVVPGGVFNLDAGVIFTINGPFDAGLYQVFSGNGNVVLGNAPISCVYPEWWGAVSDGLSDFAAQLQAAVDSLDVSDPKCVTVQLLGHNYILNAHSINIDQDNWDSLNRLVIQGTGYRSTLIIVTNDTLTEIFDSPYTGTPVEHGFLFKDFQVTTTYAYAMGTDWHPATCFYMSNGANYEFSNIYVRGFTKGWHLSENRSNDRNKFYRCFALYCKDGFYLEASSNCTSFELCNGTYCGSNAAPTSHASIFIINSKGIDINSCDFSGGRSPYILLEGVQGAHVTGCDFETISVARSITIRGISGADFSSIRNWSTGIMIEGNEFWNAWGIGIYGGTDGVSIRNNAWTNNYPPIGLDPTMGSVYICSADIDSIKNIVFDDTNSWLHQVEPPYYRGNPTNFAVKKSVVRSWGSVKPAAGTWREGDQVWDYSSPLFWTCSKSGTYGTLNTGNTTGTIITGTDANYITLNSLTDIYPGVRITIAGAGVAGADLECIVGGVNTDDNQVAISPPASTNVTDAAVSYTAPIFQTECRNYEETITTSGALSLCGSSKLDSSGGAITVTLANGDFVGQTKTIIMSDATASSTVLVTHHETSDPEAGTFDAVDETWVLLFTGLEWITLYATCTF